MKVRSTASNEKHHPRDLVEQWGGGGLLTPIESMGLVYLPTFTIKKSTIHVGKYTSPMDGMGT